MLAEPVDTFHEHHSIVDALLGLAALGQALERLGQPGGHLVGPADPTGVAADPGSDECDDTVDALVGVVRLRARLLDLVGAGAGAGAADQPAGMGAVPTTEGWRWSR